MKKLENKTKAEKDVEASDKFQQTSDQVRQKLEANKDKYTKYGTYVLVVVALIIAYLNYQNEVEKDANSAFGVAMIDYTNQQPEKARQKLEGLLLDFDGTEASARAHYVLGKIYFEQNIAQQALIHFLDYDGSDPIFKAASLAGAALCYETEKNYTLAAEYFLDAANTEERTQTSLNYKLSAALNYERANDIATAKSLLEEISKSEVEFENKRLVDLKLGLL